MTRKTDDGWQDIRLAVVLSGGVSLAVWMSGVVLELHRLTLASRSDERSPYSDLLGLIKATAEVDVVAGTSAGGLNGAFLALAQARGTDLDSLRDLWRDHGSLAALMRPALAKNPPSLLQGDAYFLPKIEQAMQTVARGRQVEPGFVDAQPSRHRPIDLILTGTLWDGHATVFSDDLGAALAERDHDATFHFSGTAGAMKVDGPGSTAPTLNDPQVVRCLARAARCSASFPGAFEPHWVDVSSADRTSPDRWRTTAGTATFSTSQFVVDGGVLRNKPIRPALQAIYRRPGARQVRRVLAYVVPSAGEPVPPDQRTGGPTSGQEAPAARPAGAGVAAGAPAAPPVAAPASPMAADVLLGVVSRLRSTDSVSAELREIRDRNRAVRQRRRSRAALVMALTPGDDDTVLVSPIAEAVWASYRAERHADAAHTIAGLVHAGQPQGAGPDAWSERELADAVLRYVQRCGSLPYVPEGTLEQAVRAEGAEWRWGQTTVNRLADITVDVLKRAVWLAGGTHLAPRVVKRRRALMTSLDTIAKERDSLVRRWSSTPTTTRLPRPVRSGMSGSTSRAGSSGQATPGSSSSALNVHALDTWFAQRIPEWDAQGANGTPGADARHAALHAQALDLAKHLAESGDVLSDVVRGESSVDPDHSERDELGRIVRWLVPGSDPQQVLARMLQLDVIQMATGGALQVAEQEVELVQVSCSDPETVTGFQLNHFGAFYRASWRLNDWIQGRLDGSTQVIRLLLAPERLRQLSTSSDQVLKAVEDIVTAGGLDADWRDSQWKAVKDDVRAEIVAALDPGCSGVVLQRTAEALAWAVQIDALRADLPELVRAIRAEGDDAPPASRRWIGEHGPQIMAKKPSCSDLWRAAQAMRAIGGERLLDDHGSDSFATTVAHAAALSTSLVRLRADKGYLRPVRFVMSALRGYTGTLWVFVGLLSRKSSFGRHAVLMATSAGLVLTALGFVVPGIPVTLTLVGVLATLAGVSAAALYAHQRALAVRLWIVAGLAAAGLAVLVRRDPQAFLTTVMTGLIAVGAVAVGWFLAWPFERRPRRRSRGR
ncbi:patatin-like protein [Cellulomonas chitinilytica]|nr:patatin-like protein [Cellulomonas chitinilytica]